MSSNDATAEEPDSSTMEKGGVEVLELSNAATMHLAFAVIGARGLSTYGRVFNAFIVSNHSQPHFFTASYIQRAS